MKHLDESQIQELHAALESEQAELERQLQERGSHVNGDWQGKAIGVQGEESDPNDVADNIEEFATNVPLVEALETRLGEVQSALQRMKEGTYGLDENGAAIPVERLRANPAANTNV